MNYTQKQPVIVEIIPDRNKTGNCLTVRQLPTIKFQPDSSTRRFFGSDRINKRRRNK